MTESFQIAHLVTIAAWIGGAALIGVVIDLIVRARLRRTGTMTGWGGQDVAVDALRHTPLIWSLLLGITGAAYMLPLEPDVRRTTTRALVAIAIASVTLVLSRLAAGSVRVYALRQHGGLRSGSILVSIVRLTIFAVGLLVLLQTMGVSITPLLTALGVGGLAVALALQDTLTNLFAGLHLIASRKIRPGDFVRLDEQHEGYVVDINWRNTTIRQLANNLIVVPNSRIGQEVITNFHRPAQELALLIDLEIAYGTDLAHAETVLHEVGVEVQTTVPGAVRDFDPLVRFRVFGDSGIGVTLVLRVQEYTEQFFVRHEAIKRLHERLAREGITIPFPQRTIWFEHDEGAKDGNREARVPRASRKNSDV